MKKVQGKLKKAIELVKDTFGRKVELDGLDKLPSNNIITEPIKETNSTSQNSTLHKIEQKEERNDDDEDDEMKEAIALSLKLEVFLFWNFIGYHLNVSGTTERFRSQAWSLANT